jgi:hypothetical protein
MDDSAQWTCSIPFPISNWSCNDVQSCTAVPRCSVATAFSHTLRSGGWSLNPHCAICFAVVAFDWNDLGWFSPAGSVPPRSRLKMYVANSVRRVIACCVFSLNYIDNYCSNTAWFSRGYVEPMTRMLQGIFAEK